MNNILKRLKEPSTYAGFAVVAAAFGVSTDDWQTISMAIAGVAGVVAMVLREKNQD